MVKKILIMLCLMTMIITISYSQTYTITLEELQILEATIVEQQKTLTEQAKDLIALRQEIAQANAALTRHLKSFDEYESAALRIQTSLRDEIANRDLKLRGWQIALPITGAVALTGGLLIGIFAK